MMQKDDTRASVVRPLLTCFIRCGICQGGVPTFKAQQKSVLTQRCFKTRGWSAAHPTEDTKGQLGENQVFFRFDKMWPRINRKRLGR